MTQLTDLINSHSIVQSIEAFDGTRKNAANGSKTAKVLTPQNLG